jgi:hypothetical protein
MTDVNRLQAGNAGGLSKFRPNAIVRQHDSKRIGRIGALQQGNNDWERIMAGYWQADNPATPTVFPTSHRTRNAHSHTTHQSECSGYASQETGKEEPQLTGVGVGNGGLPPLTATCWEVLQTDGRQLHASASDHPPPTTLTCAWSVARTYSTSHHRSNSASDSASICSRGSGRWWRYGSPAVQTSHVHVCAGAKRLPSENAYGRTLLATPSHAGQATPHPQTPPHQSKGERGNESFPQVMCM